VYKVCVQCTGDHALSELINSTTSTNVGTMMDERRLEILQSLNIIIGSHAKTNRDVVSIGANKHYLLKPPPEDTWDLGTGLVALRGFFYSARVASSRMLLNVQVKSSAFYQSGSLYNILNVVWSANNGSMGAINKFVRGLSIRTTHLKPRKNKAGREVIRVKSIWGVAGARDGVSKAKNANPPKVPRMGATPSQVKFFLEPRDGKTGPGKYVSVKEYFQQSEWPPPGPSCALPGTRCRNLFFFWLADAGTDYPHIKLLDPELPVLNIGSQQKPSYVPAEACLVLPGQPVNAMLKGAQTDAMRAQAVRPPGANAQSIVGAGPRTIGLVDPLNTTLVSGGGGGGGGGIDGLLWWSTCLTNTHHRLPLASALNPSWLLSSRVS
jgi:hypothetical protein